MPQPPQFASLATRLVHVPPQFVSPAAQHFESVVPVPTTGGVHAGVPPVHAVPHMPQLVVLMSTLVQIPPQQVSVPPVQATPPPVAVQPPQFASSLSGSTH
jgi:hypothetical protein